MSTRPRKTEPIAAYHHGDLRRALIASGRDLLREGGTEALTLRAVAARAGVSVAAPYRHFPDKDALVAAVLAHGLGDLRRGLRESPAADPLDRLHALGHRFVDLAIEEPELVRLLGSADLRPDAHPELVEAVRETFASFAVAVEEAVAAGVLAVESTDTALLTMRCLVQGMAGLIAHGAIPPEHAHDLADQVMATVDRGLLAREP